MQHFVVLSLLYRMVYKRVWLTPKNMSNTSNYCSHMRHRIIPQWKKGISHDSISNERIVVLMRNDAELNALSDQYRFSLKYFLKIVYFQLILDKYEPNETSMIFCRYSPSKWLMILTIWLKFITKRFATSFFIGSTIKWLKILCGPNRLLMHPCPFGAQLSVTRPKAAWWWLLRKIKTGHGISLS
jgi:hypothetical protein